MQETLAAAVIMASGWHGNGHFINPMCGSGTIAIEAAMIRRNSAPGMLRENFGFMHVRGFDRAGWNRTLEEAKKQIKKISPYKIIATDSDRGAVTAAKKNARSAGVEQDIVFQVCDYKETPIPSGGGVVMLNPAYGERLGRNHQLETVYKEIGDFFKHYCQGYRGYVFTGNLAMAKKIGLRTKRRLQFFNGKIECRLLEYDLYAGSLRHDQV
jgi:putative N6-adenine-specific DNA methylase